MESIMPPVEYLKYIKDLFDDLDSEDIPHVEVEITTDPKDAPQDCQ